MIQKDAPTSSHWYHVPAQVKAAAAAVVVVVTNAGAGVIITVIPMFSPKKLFGQKSETLLFGSLYGS